VKRDNFVFPFSYRHLFLGPEANYEISNKIEGDLAGIQAVLLQRTSLDAFGYSIFVTTFDKILWGHQRQKMHSADRKFLIPFIVLEGKGG